jgi:hypothetical protein
MSRLKRREPFGKAGLTVAILALVLAMVGGAWAAAGLNSKQKKEVTKIAKKFAGKPGAAGANGTNGTNGTAGAKGELGAAGAPGVPGINGKSVLHGTTAPSVGTGTEGDFYINTTTDEIFGPKTTVWGSGTSLKGTTGFTKFLPSGESERGVWSILLAASEGGQPGSSPISFNIPLAVGVPASYIGVEEGEGEPKENLPAGCSGTVGEPVASKGHLCVFARTETNAGLYSGVAHFLNPETTAFNETGQSGVVVAEQSVEEGPMSANGTWVVTAP